MHRNRSEVLFTAPGAMMRRAGMGLATCIYRMRLGGCGTGTRFQTGVRIRGAGQVRWGVDGYLWSGVTASSELPDGWMEAGDRVQVNRDVHLDFTGGLRLGDDVLISEQAMIYTHDHGLDPRAPARPCPKVIGAGVWVGMRAVILPGCRNIGAGAVIGAGAIVTRDVAPGAVVVGNPARPVATRNRAGVAA